MALAKKKKADQTREQAEKLAIKPRLVWDELSPEDRQASQALARDYLDFLTRSKTERAVVKNLRQRLAEAGFIDLARETGSRTGPGGFLIHHQKLLGLWRPGLSGPESGFNLIVAHGDSPRLDLKPKCVYEEKGPGLGLLRTNLYGGLKKYQWLARPLALWGFCALKDGRTVDIIFGEDPGDPVLTVPDLLPHLDRKVQREKKMGEAIVADKMNLLAAALPLGEPEDKDRLKLAVLKILHDRWGLSEEDLISSELEIVPAGPAREVGLDGALLGGYGHDDRLSVFAALSAVLNSPQSRRPTLMIVYDREEIGSYGATGAGSRFLEDLAARAFEASGLEPRWANVREALRNSQALSADVEAAMDPDYKEVHEEYNSARLGRGPCLVRYTGGAGKYGASEASAEYVAKLRTAFDRAGILWQSALLGKQEEGGGGTVALFLAAYGLNVIDCGPPVISMHSPFEIASKADLFMTVRAYEAFLNME